MMKEYIHKMPKAELHCHLDGSVPLATLKDLASQEGIDPASMDGVRVPEKCEDLAEYLEAFDLILPVLQSQDNLTRATYDIIAEVAADGVRYIELRFAPLLHTDQGLSVAEVIEAVQEGVRRGTEDYPVYVNLILCLMRHEDNETNQAVIDQVLPLKQDYLVAFDFAGNELDGANDHIEDLTESIQAEGYQLTLHSGECGCPHNIAQAMRLGASRVGHGIAIKDDLSLLEEARDHQLVFEMCPTSNYQTDAVKELSELPLALLMEHEIPVTINTDNRTVSNTTLSREFEIVTDIFNLSKCQLNQLNQNAIRNAFADQETIDRVSQEMTEYWQTNS